MALPELPAQGQNPWYTPRTDWDLAVKSEIEGRLSESSLNSVFGTELSAASYLMGGSDDSAGLQAASNAARTFGLTLYIPPVEVRLLSRVLIYGSLRNDGRIVYEGAEGGLDFVRTVEQINIDPDTLPPLVRGMTSIEGLPGAGTLSITSSEELIKRIIDGAYIGSYTKNETVAVSATGELFTPLTDTYDMSQVTSVIFWPEDEPISIDGLTLVSTTSATDTIPQLLNIERSNVTVNNLMANNIAAVGPTACVRVRWSTNLVFNSPTINGFMKPGAGYGLVKYFSTGIVVNDPAITDCRHGIAGRHDHSVTVNRGFLSGYDTHWGWNLTLNDVDIEVGQAGNTVLVAGGNFIVRGGRMRGGRSIVGIRLDTPECSGVISVRDVQWSPSLEDPLPSAVWVVGYSSINNPSHGGLTFGRILDFANVHVENVTVTLPTPQTFATVHMGNMTFDRNLPRNIRIDRVGVVNPGTLVRDVLIWQTSSVHQTGNTVIEVSNITRPEMSAGGINLSDTANMSLAFDYRFTNVNGLSVVHAEFNTRSFVADGCTITRLQSTGTSNPNIRYAIRNSVMRAVPLTGFWKADYLGTIWEGTSTSTGSSLDGRCASFIGSSRLIGAVGPSFTGDYRNPAFYS